MNYNVDVCIVFMSTKPIITRRRDSFLIEQPTDALKTISPEVEIFK